jgi:hypothetical protein
MGELALMPPLTTSPALSTAPDRPPELIHDALGYQPQMHFCLISKP